VLVLVGSRSRLKGNYGFPSLSVFLQVNLGSHQYLFTIDVDPSKMPCLCLRHDVDALVWQPRPDRPGDIPDPTQAGDVSVPTGYVQASKRDKKFATCSPDFSYATLCECLRRVFIYCQPSPVETILFNRKQGRQVGQVAKQQVASLDCDKPILGFRASNERLFILTSSTLFVLKVKQN
ncbi:NudC domain-containing protein 1, partial [Goodea atripinnis]